MESTELDTRHLLQPLYEGIKENNYEKVQYLLKYGDSSKELKRLLKFNQFPNKRMNPLSVAVKSSASEKIITILLEAGADPNEHVLHSPFLWSIRKKDLKSVKLFMQYGGSPFKSPNILLTASRKKYHDKNIIDAIAQSPDISVVKSYHKRQLYILLRHVLKLGNLNLIESLLKNIECFPISRSFYQKCRKDFISQRYAFYTSPIVDLIIGTLWRNCTAFLSPGNYKELFRLIEILYKMMNKEDRQHTIHDFTHAKWRHYCLNGDSYSDVIQKADMDVLEMVVCDLKDDINLNCKYNCGDNNTKETLLVCAFRRDEILAENLIKLGANLSQLKFEDLSLIYRLKNGNRLMKLLVAAGFRLPKHFNIEEFLNNTDFSNYVCWTGSFVDYYIEDKMVYLYKRYTVLLPRFQMNLQSLVRMAFIQNTHPHTLNSLVDRLPKKLKKFMQFSDCDDEYDTE